MSEWDEYGGDPAEKEWLREHPVIEDPDDYIHEGEEAEFEDEDEDEDFNMELF